MTITKAHTLTVSAPADQTPGQLDLFAAGDIVAEPANRSEPLEAKSPVGGAFGQAAWTVLWRGLARAWDWMEDPSCRPFRFRESAYDWCEREMLRDAGPGWVPGLLRTLILMDYHELTYLYRCVGAPREFVDAETLMSALAACPVTTHTEYQMCHHVRMTPWARQETPPTRRVYRAYDICPRCRPGAQRRQAEAAGWAALVGGVREVALAEEMRAIYIPALVVEWGSPRVNDILTQLLAQDLAQRADARWWIRRFPWDPPNVRNEVCGAALMRMTASQAATLLAEGDSELKDMVTRAFASRYGTP